MEPKAITVAILAMGGEGGGVLADWIVDMAEQAGCYAQTTSVPGVAQRTGATIYYLEIFPALGRQPVLALMPVPGEVDVVIASELMEAGRAIQRGLVTADRTVLIASTHRVYSMTERTAMGDGRVDAVQLTAAVRAAARLFIESDFAAIAQNSSSVISAALFGALASSGALPFDRAQFEDAIRRSGVGVESSLTAFAAGHSAVPSPGVVTPARGKVGPLLQTLAARVEKDFAPGCHALLLAGIERLADYQDVRYAAHYLDLLRPLQQSNGPVELLRETARHLALWMSYEDAIRVADLKIRRSRFERVHTEARVQPGQLLRINEFLHPGAQEIADILPSALARWVLKSRFAGRGRVVQTTCLSGYLQLYLIASLRPLRRRSLRFEREQKQIEAWLRQIYALALRDYALAVEVVECPRLLKGYGDTHVRGSRNFARIMAALPAVEGTPAAATRLKALREAALADETGEKLTAALKELPA